MRIALAQFNPLVGDLQGNAAKMAEFAAQAHNAGAQLLLSPELSICGYPPEDLLLRPAFVSDCERALLDLAKTIGQRAPSLTAIIGVPHQVGDRLYNGAAVVRGGAIKAWYHKRELPNYAVFDEKRYFSAGDAPLVIEIDGAKLGVLICEDTWFATASASAKDSGAQGLVVINGSPYNTRQHAARREVVGARARETALPVVYLNMVGGQDELVFDGHSFVANAAGEVTQQLPAFHETLALVELERVGERLEPKPVRGGIDTQDRTTEHVYQALTLGVKDYINKNGFKGVLLGLSGGIDSAVVLAIAVDALGRDRVRALMLPSQYNLSISLEDARTMASTLGVRYDEISIEPMFQAFSNSLAEQFKGLPIDATEENLQSRIRGTLLMGISNKTGWLVLTTGNKSEMTTGYATLYGDMAGGFGVLKDIDKGLVYALANWRNTLGQVIPERVITRPPSAELRPDQKDQDSLPPYDDLDRIMELYVEQNMSPRDIVAAGNDPAYVQKIVRLIKINEYKRRQAPVGPRITPRGYGRDWRYPITSGYSDWKDL